MTWTERWLLALACFAVAAAVLFALAAQALDDQSNHWLYFALGLVATGLFLQTLWPRRPTPP